MALVYAKVIALFLARLLELSVEAKEDRRVTNQLALVLALTRCAPMLLSVLYMDRGIILAQLEERILMIASIAERSRNQRRERTRLKRERAPGHLAMGPKPIAYATAACVCPNKTETSLKARKSATVSSAFCF